MIVEGHITDESIKSKLSVDEFGLFREKRTNVDRIRAMPVEELAETITEDWCSILCPGGSFFCDGECLNKMIEWLKQECE